MTIKLIFVSLFFGSISQAQVYGFSAVPSGDKTQGSVTEVTNLQPVMSQDSLGVCYAYAASTMLSAENCRYQKTDCTKIENKDIFSPIALTKYSTIENGEMSYGAGAKIDGGSAANVMQLVAYQTHSAPSEECVSLDKILSKIGGAKDATDIQTAAWEKLEKTYDKYQSLKKECPTCAADFFATAKDEINQNFEIKTSNEDMLKAFGKETYSEFVARLFFPPECSRAKNSAFFEAKDVKVGFYPETGKKGDYAGTLKQIKKTLGEKRPLALGNICLDEKPSSKDCKNQHQVVVSGYRKVCNSQNKCYDAIKIVNSWGQSWQSANSDGWVDAKQLLDRTYYKDATLTYFEDKAATQ